MQGRQPALVTDLDIGAPFEKQGDDVGMAGQRRDEKGRFARGIGLGHDGALVQQLFRETDIARFRRIVQRIGDSTVDAVNRSTAMEANKYRMSNTPPPL